MSLLVTVAVGMLTLSLNTLDFNFWDSPFFQHPDHTIDLFISD